MLRATKCFRAILLGGGAVSALMLALPAAAQDSRGADTASNQADE